MAALVFAQTKPAPPQLEAARRSLLAVVEDGAAPSVVVTVARHGRILWNEAVGWADREQQRKAMVETPYSIASVTKPVTATAIMLLSDRGKISLEDPLTSYTPAIERPNVQDPAEVTIRRLLSHTAGFPVHYQYFYADQAARPAPFIDTMRCFGAEIGRPGRRYIYSNLGFEALRAVVEKASGEAFRDYLVREIFVPLGMLHTKVVEDESQLASAAVRYATGGERLPFYWTDHPGASAVYATAADLARFGQFHTGTASGTGLLRPESIAAMQMPGLGNYGLGWSVNPNWHGRLVVYHSGAMPGSSATLWVVPAEQISIALTANQIGVPVNRIAGEILQLLLGTSGESPAVRAIDEAPGEEPSLPVEDPHGRWHGTWSTCPNAKPISIDVEPAGTIVTTVDGKLFKVSSPTVTNGRLMGEIQTSPRVTYRLDLRASGGRLRGPVVRRTGLGPRGSTLVTLWADLS